MTIKHRHTVRTRLATLTLTATLGLATLAAAPAAATSPTPSDRDLLQPLIEAGYPGAMITVTQDDGSASGATAGVSNLDTGQAPALDSHVQIGSNTKTFVAVIILQLVEEGKLSLDDAVETHLPGLLTGEGIDGTKITIRQLLQHTSGLPEYTDDALMQNMMTNPTDYWAPQDLLAHALAKPAQFEPGAQFTYTNTNYVVLGMLIEKVTHRTVASEIEDRIAEPLGLTRTYLPAPGETGMPAPHLDGYSKNPETGELQDYTEGDLSWGWAAGGVTSTPSELNTFMQAILDGRLLSAESLAEMQTTVSAGDKSSGLSEYGLGFRPIELSCGTAWGHGGGTLAHITTNAALPGGPAATIAVNAHPAAIVDDPTDPEQSEAKVQLIVDALEASLCR